MTAREYLDHAHMDRYQEPWWIELQRVLPERARQIALDQIPFIDAEWLQIDIRRELVRQGVL